MWRSAAQFSYVGIFFGVAVVIGWLGGRWLEKKVGGAPWVSLAGVLFGVAAGFRELYRIAKSITRGSHD
jgi:ATP synthase protein I